MPAQKIKRYTCCVLSRTKLSEQDLIITFLTSEGEKLQAVAKGARKPGSRLAARVDLFCVCDVVFTWYKGTLPYIKEAELIDSHIALREDIDKLYLASAALEVARAASFEDATDPVSFAMLTELLRAIEYAQTFAQASNLLSAYIFKITAFFGWHVQLDGCVVCGGEHFDAFSPQAGGSICSSCIDEDEELPALSGEVHGWLEFLMGATFKEIAHTECDEYIARNILHLAHRWAETHLEVRLYSLGYLFDF